jgi:hypothetical protein
MPDPGYTDGDGPGFVGLFLGTVVIVIVFLIIKSCMW